MFNAVPAVPNKFKKPAAEDGSCCNKNNKRLKNRGRNFRNSSNFQLKPVGDKARLAVDVKERTPIFLNDIQNLILYISLEPSSFYPHRWFERLPRIDQTVVLVVENLSLQDYLNNESHFPNVKSNFPIKLEIVTPGVYKGDLIEELLTIPAITTRNEILTEEYGSLEKALSSVKAFKMLKAVFPVKIPKKRTDLGKNFKLPENDRFPRTNLLLSAWQLVEENYPLHLEGELKQKYADYVMSKDVYEDVTDHSPLFGLDCEMCLTTSGHFEVTRITIVNERHELFYEKLVKPYDMVVNYFTEYSGISESTLKNITTTLQEVHQHLRKILPPDAILVGQNIHADLHALKLIHPYIIDTSIIFNTTGIRRKKSRFENLKNNLLGISNHTVQVAHNSLDNSINFLKLVQLKLQHCIEFGNEVHSIYLKNYRLHYNYFGTSLLHHLTKMDKTVQIIAKEKDIDRYRAFIHVKTEVQTSRITCIEKKRNKQSVEYIGKSMKCSDVTFAHFKIPRKDKTGKKIKKTCETIDQHVQKIWQESPINTIFIVLFGGNAKSSGVGFINNKKGVPNL